jgi:alanyl-tRNA synthetase
MLGNFSIGDYFREEAITWAYELLTSPKYFDIDKDKLYVTVYTHDDDTYNLWLKLGIKKDHLVRLDGNFWEIGPGPSGPDTEIFYDRGEKYDKEHKGISLLQNEEENDRYIEIWNNVLSQFNATEGLKREDYPELPSKNIDTGMGVERMACILQETETNYETDLFIPIMKGIEEISHLPYTGQIEFKVIADHIRTLTFALADGAVFENVGRGYVLRRLLRRASRMGRKLNINRLL